MRKYYIFISSLIFIVYSNTFYSSWQLDDKVNITKNEKLQIYSLTTQQIINATRANPVDPDSNKLYRPIPCVTFGLNWYLGQDDVLGYHIVNTAVHIFTAWFLFLTLHLLLRIYYKKKEHLQTIDTAALLGTLFWALAPIQTQAVTYIVQRMASMAAMFGIIAIYAYLLGRTSTKGKIYWFLLSFLAFFAALGSKENVITLLPSFILIEYAFLKHQITKRQFISFALAGTLVLIVAIFFVRYGLGLAPFSLSDPLRFLDSYSNRSFTFSQRILTQPRIILMYLFQIFLPAAGRLSIEHEFVLSTSLFSPWTTLPSVVGILSLIGISIVFLKKHPLICFPILFYFLNHAVESTILQLEMVFEHRNYLPSFFLFLPAGAVFAQILHSIPPQPFFRRSIAAFCATLFLIISGHATYARNMAWATEETLWSDAFKKAPNSPRAAGHLGEWYSNAGQIEEAYLYFQLALKNSKNDPTPEQAKITALNRLGILSLERGDNKKALYFFNQCLSSDIYTSYCLKNRIISLLRLNSPEQAINDAKILVDQYPNSAEYQYLLAFLYYKIEDIDNALITISRISSSLDDHQAMQLTGVIFLKKHDYQNSLFFLRKAEEIFPSLENKINLAAISYLAGYHVPLDKIIHAIFAGYKKENIDLLLKEDRYNILTEDMRQYFYDKFEKMSYHHEQQTSSP